MQLRPNVTGLSVLETIWMVAHSERLREHMADVDNASLDHLQKVCMFEICLGDIRGSQAQEGEREAFLEWRNVCCFHILAGRPVI